MRVRKLLRHAGENITNNVEITHKGHTLVSGDILHVFRSEYADGKVDTYDIVDDGNEGLVLSITLKS